MGRDVGRWGGDVGHGAGPRQGDGQARAGPLLRTCIEGARQHSKGGPLECGVLEFGGNALSEGVWVGFRPSLLEGVSECRGGALGEGVGVGLGLCVAGGRLWGRGLGPGAQQASWCLSGLGTHWPCSLPFLRTHPHRLPQGLPRRRWTPNHGWVPLGVGTPPLPQPSFRGAGPEVRPLLLLPLPSLPLPQDLRGWMGPPWAEDQAQNLSRFLGAQVGRGNLATLPFDPLPSQWSPNFPLRAWDPFPSPSRPSGAPVLSSLHFSSPFTPPTPHVLPCRWGLLRPLRCP